MKSNPLSPKVMIILIAVATLIILLLVFLVFGDSRKSSDRPAGQESIAEEDKSNQPKPAESSQPVRTEPIEEDVAEDEPVSGLLCQPTSEAELPVTELDELLLLEDVADCRYEDRVYRRYLRSEFEKALPQILNYLIEESASDDRSLAEYCRDAEFQTILTESQQLLLISEQYVFNSQTSADKEFLRDLLADDFDLIESIDIC